MHAEIPFDPDAVGTAGSIFGLPFGPEEAALHLFPVPWQATTSFRRGTRAGPQGVLEASTQVDLFDVEYSDFWRAGIYLHPEDPEIVSWDTEAEPLALGVIAALSEGGDAPDAEALERVNELGRLLNEKVYEKTRALLADGRIPAVLGGDHSVPFGAIQAVAERHPGMGVLHIDAHADLRDAYEGFTWSHASIFHNVLHHVPGVARIVQVGIRDVGQAEVELQLGSHGRVVPFYDAEIGEALAEGSSWLSIVRRIVAALPEEVWISLDIDGLDPALCPGTGTPVPGGLSSRDLCVLLKEVSRTRRILGFDLNEVGPGDWDGIVGARVLYKLCGATLRAQK